MPALVKNVASFTGDHIQDKLPGKGWETHVPLGSRPNRSIPAAINSFKPFLDTLQKLIFRKLRDGLEQSQDQPFVRDPETLFEEPFPDSFQNLLLLSRQAHLRSHRRPPSIYGHTSID